MDGFFNNDGFADSELIFLSWIDSFIMDGFADYE